MSLIGTLEQFSLANVLQRTEGHKKTGLLTIRQGAQWIEFYIREGRLLCVGPLRTSATLGERLLQDGIISPAAFQEISRVLGEASKNEAQAARTLMELRHVSRDDLRNWTIKNTTEVLKVLLVWTSGEIYFDDNAPSPTERLLVSMSISTLLANATAALSPSATVAKPSVYTSIGTTPVMPVQPVPPMAPVPQQTGRPASPATTPPRTPRTPAPDVARVPTLMSASQFLDDSSFAASSFATSFPATGAIEPVAKEEPEKTPSFADVSPSQSDGGFLSLFGEDDASVQKVAPALQPVPVMNPVPPKRIDTSFMLPDMVLLPTDLSAYREQNPQVQLTPDQWCILTRVDGRTPLTVICQELGSTPDIVCPVIGELIAEGLIMASLPNEQPSQEPSPVSRELVASGLGNGYVAPGYASAAASPWSASMPAVPASDAITPAPGGPAVGNSVETESQWGNGGNGATFVPGRGWVTAPQPMQPLQPSGSLTSLPGGIYAPAGNSF
ncbi:DUF4388 domain-containing protein [Dictyobacter formicarum]|uniref:PatA-like N-terminal domain-containing protein n=1 Tax=Dictyobacter formicarum TaxID=2778368 RepID=A0ABQ3VS93_9CHLR|nr:DUF4388 domain-containing protein [Dictyobacter formicarum]GHO89065.1 hypothetical protein KSZ_70710 [Dictyobacter formicarum]